MSSHANRDESYGGCKLIILVHIYQPAVVDGSTGEVDGPCQNSRHWTPGTVSAKSSSSELDMADCQSKHYLSQYLGPDLATLSLGGQMSHVVDGKIL